MAFGTARLRVFSINVSAKRAFHLLVSARFIDAATAADWGLINAAVPDAELDAAVARQCAVIAAKSPTAIRFGKAMFHRQRQMPLAEAYAYAGEVMAQNMMEEDALAGVDPNVDQLVVPLHRRNHAVGVVLLDAIDHLLGLELELARHGARSTP